MVKLSATIVTLNEEKNIARAIESLRCCEEIVVVDSGSSDRTKTIANQRGARVIPHAWPGYAQQKNWAAAQASNDWILSIDADEALSEELEAELLALKSAGPDAAGYSMPRMAQYLGKWIRHSGWYPDRKLRLYDRRRCSWKGEYVHESVHVEGPVGLLRSNLLHFTCDSLSAHMKTLDGYTTLRRKSWLRKAPRVPVTGWRWIRCGRRSCAHLFFSVDFWTDLRVSRSRTWRRSTPS